MRHPSTAALFRYWNTLRGDRPAPRRIEIEPRAIAPELRDVFLIEGPAGEFRFRLAGSRIVDSLGQSLTGRPFEDIFADRTKLAALSALWIAAEDGEPMLIGIRKAGRAEDDAPRAAKPGAPRPAWLNFRDAGGIPKPERRQAHSAAGELLLLPLSHRNGIGDRLIGALAFFDPPAEPARIPERLDLTGSRMLGRAARPASGPGLLPAAMAESVIGRRGHLIVMRGRKDTE
ncbi:PAS domain-containing protein [Rhabdaerophilum calidifontis]|uniref:PAS domain-containing protein n=1 Tax=Rhabdaerophilum calidifontis TaxID=2604328 RepID=UPI0014086DC7|nr:PAS domain-containing protein [Rhabdaerophilum calidifontis]